MFGLGIGEGLLIAFIALLLFGLQPFVKLAGSAGRGIKEFKRALSGKSAGDHEEGPGGS